MIDVLTTAEQELALQLARETCWENGDLSWLFDKNQEGIYEKFSRSKNKYFILECARRLGKSYLLCAIAIEQCLKRPRSQVLYAAPTTKDANEIVAPLIEEICRTAPFKVKYDSQAQKFKFPNGSQIRLFGCDDKHKADRGRGTNAHLVLIDEAGFIPVLDYVLHSIVSPQTLTTRGRVLLASTPSSEPDHPFTRLAEKAEANGNYVRRTIYDNPRLTEREIAEYIADDASMLGMTVEEFKVSDVYKREHLALRAIDTNLVVIPEWGIGFLSDAPKPEFYDAYVSLDFGGVDPHAALFGYWNFQEQCLFIEDELLLRDGENSAVLAERIKAKEQALWGVDGWDGTLRGAKEFQRLPEWLKEAQQGKGRPQPYLRVCDNDIALARDLQQLHKLSFIPSEKHDKILFVNATRVLFRQGKIKVHPRCRNLDRHLRTTMWLNERQRDFRRINGEHGDLVDALVYMVRNLRHTKDPTPGPNFARDYDNTWERPNLEKKTMWGKLLPSWRKKV